MLKCKDLSKLPSLHHLQYITGKSGTDKVIRWFYTAETMDFSMWIRGGELLIVSGTVSQSQDFDLMQLVKQAIKLRLAGVVFLCGPGYLKEISRRSVEYAQSHNFALMAIPWDVPLVDITEEIGRAIMIPDTGRDRHRLSAAIFGNLSYAAKTKLFSAMGYPYSEPQCLMLVCYDRPTLDDAAGDRITPEDVEELCASYLLQHGFSCCDTMQYEQVLMLVACGDFEPQALLGEIHDLLKAHYPEMTFHISASCAADALSLESTYEETQAALRIAQACGDDAPYIFQPRGMDEFLLMSHEPEYFQHYAEKVLKPLLVYDAKNHSDLLKTLEIYLETNGNLQHTAKQLFVHRNTLKYRIQRIEKILECSLEEPRVRFMLYFAIRIRMFK